MSLLFSFSKSLAMKLVLAFILAAVPPMLAASHVASRMVSDAANANIGRWLRETSRYLFRSIKDTEEEIAAVHTLLHARFARKEVVFAPEELLALPGLNVDCVVTRDAPGGTLLSDPRMRSVAETPLYPGSPFRWATMKDGEQELAVVVRRDIMLEDGAERGLELVSLFGIRLAENGGEEPVELRIFLPDGDGFRQEYASSPSGSQVLPLAAIRAMRAGAGEYAVFDADWTDDVPDQYVLFTPARNDRGDILAVFAVSARMLPHQGHDALFWSLFFGGILLSGCIGYALARRLTRPVRRLNEGVRNIAAGNFNSRVAVQGNDEVAELSTGFNLMAGQLEIMQRESAQSARHERSRMLGEIALGFAHEIRNPLLVIKTSAELVHGKLPGKGQESRLLGFVIEEVGRIDNLISEFLSFAKPAPLKLGYFRLDALANEVLELSAAECAARGIICSFADETGGARVLGEADKIRQVLLNLVLNSLDAMPQGGSLAIRVYAPDKLPRVCFDVRDTGVGIPEALLPTVHLPFISTKKNGLGLGLAKARAVVEEHGGSIACVSAPGEGTVFTVCLNV